MNITVLVTAHREGPILRMTLNSLNRCRIHAERRGVSTEIVLIGDDMDAQTEQVADAASVDLGITVERVRNRDLGLSRNAGIARARGEWVAIADGDDLYGLNWLTDCYETATSHPGSCIVHPELAVMFGAETGYYWQRGQNTEYFDPACALHINPFNSCAFAKRSVFERHPYQSVEADDSGFGYEDWHWNCETMASGVTHIVARGVVQFIRRRGAKSLSRLQDSRSAISRPSALFETL